MNIKSHKAVDLRDALEQLNKYGKNGKIIAGGTDVVIELKNKEISPEIMIDISDVKEITSIGQDEDYIRIGAGVTFTEIVKSDILGKNLVGLVESAHSVGSPQIRNTGTVGGNICNGSPAADTVPPLLALDSKLIVHSIDGSREVPLRDFFLNKGQVALEENEMLVEIIFKKPGKSQVVTFSKLGLRKALAISRICTSVYLDVQDSKVVEARIGNGALGRYGVREDEVESFLTGKAMDEETLESAVNLMGQKIDDRLKGRSSVEFKAEAVKGIFKSALLEAMEYYK